MRNDVRTPKVGDLVSAIGHNTAFYVTKVDDRMQTVDLKLVQSESVLNNAPWIAISYSLAKGARRDQE